MKFSIGDPVYVKSNQEEGRLVAFVSGEMAEVEVNGKRYVVYLSDLDHPYLNWFLNKKKDKKVLRADRILPESKGRRSSGLSMGIYLAFFPEYRFDGMEDVVEKIRVFLYNETWQDLQIDYTCVVRGESLFSLAPRLIPESEVYVHDIDFESASQNPLFTVQCADLDDPAKQETFTFTLKGKKLHEYLHQLRFKNEAFFSHLLSVDVKVPPPIKVIKSTVVHPVPASKKSESHFDFEKAQKLAKNELDLHASALGLDERRLSSSEILHFQLREARKAIDLAMATHQSELILIHGVGKGVLKSELHRVLDQTNGVVSYVNEYDSRYGHGATRVIFRY